MKIIHMYFVTIKYFLQGTDWNYAKGFAEILVYGFRRKGK